MFPKVLSEIPTFGKRYKSFCILIYLSGFLTPVILFFCFSESYWPFNPYIDTKFAPSFNEHKFESLELGAPADSLPTLLGEPLWKEGCGGCWEPGILKNAQGVLPTKWQCSEPCAPQSTRDIIWQYSVDGACTWWDFAWKYYAVHPKRGSSCEIFALDG